MRLKALSLHGYKSFASRCTFAFADGITAVVGPNGSGKSNVADAIRWVLGEQSYRSMRARTTEDMIFAGSRHRARLGMAEALITLDNSDHWLPVDYAEVTIGRRAYRSGENEYLLNESRVRYRDILDLLGAAGLSRTTYTVIGQGMVDAALALRPEARRMLFEEAAGISPQLRKRSETLDRIGETERNLERVADILNELGPRVGGLRRQAERAQEHHLLEQDLNELLRIWYGHRWHQLQEAQAAVEAALVEHQQRFEVLQGQAETTAAAQQAASSSQSQLQAQLECLEHQYATLREEVQREQQALTLSAERERLYQRQLHDIASDEDTLISRQGVLAQEIARAEHDLATLADQRKAAEQGLSALSERRAEVEQAMVTLQEAIRKRERELRNVQSRSAQQQARHQELLARLQRLEHDVADAESEAQAQEAALQSIERQMTPLRQRREAANAALERGSVDAAALQAELEALQQELSTAQAASEELRGRYSQLSLRRNSLARQREDGADYAPGVRHVLGLADTLGGILGTAAGLMQVPQAYEQAVEAALGARLQNIIVERWADAERAISRLKSDRAGWATFLPLDTLRSRGALRIRDSQGVVGVASSLVSFPEHLRPVYELLLGRVLVTSDLAAARRLLAERTGASLMVTVAGETVQPTGAVSGGARRNSSQLLAQERAWRELPDKIAQIEEQLRQKKDTVAALRARAEELRQALAQLDRERSRQRREVEQIAQALAELEGNRRVAERDARWQRDRAARALAERQQVLAQAHSLESETESSAAAEQAHTAALAGLREELAAADDEPLRRQLAELETQLAVAGRALASQEQLLASHQAAQQQNQLQLAAKRSQQEALSQTRQHGHTQAQQHRAQLAALQTQQQELQGQLTTAQKALQASARTLREAEERHAGGLARMHEVEAELHRAQLDLERVQERQQDLISEIEAALGPVSLPETISHQLRLGIDGGALELPPVAVVPAGLDQEVRSLRSRLRRLGGINPDAPQEYQALLERQAFLESQMQDLQAAIAALRQVIQELDDVIEKDFSQTVQVVDRAFREYFRRLFDGGSAHLELTNPEDLSTSGVEIVAHPPGKRSQMLSLLSGGERALTAVALVFALLRANPVPFCFLDEVDAALDEANVGRFRDLLLEHARDTQFVVITHNRRTIEIANCIYGISMGEQGVSESISLRLEEETLAQLQADGSLS